jgi:hypothetical protein
MATTRVTSGEGECQGAFLGGKIGIHSEGLGNFYSPTLAGTAYYKLRQTEPTAELVGLYSTGPGGAKGVTRNTQGSFGFTAIALHQQAVQSRSFDSSSVEPT